MLKVPLVHLSIAKLLTRDQDPLYRNIINADWWASAQLLVLKLLSQSALQKCIYLVLSPLPSCERKGIGQEPKCGSHVSQL